MNERKGDSMLFLGVIIILLAIASVLVEGTKDKVYDEYCKLECWSRRKPCCRTT
jgi:hypothetical protein